MIDKGRLKNVVIFFQTILSSVLSRKFFMISIAKFMFFKKSLGTVQDVMTEYIQAFIIIIIYFNQNKTISKTRMKRLVESA